MDTLTIFRKDDTEVTSVRDIELKELSERNAFLMTKIANYLGDMSTLEQDDDEVEEQMQDIVVNSEV